MARFLMAGVALPAMTIGLALLEPTPHVLKNHAAIVGADACTGDRLADKPNDKCYNNCIRNDCDFQGYPCSDPATLKCDKGVKYKPRVSPASCSKAPEMTCSLKCTDIAIWVCTLNGQKLLDPQCMDATDTTRCRMDIKTNPWDGTPDTVKRHMGSGDHCTTDQAWTPVDKYRCDATKDNYKNAK